MTLDQLLLSTDYILLDKEHKLFARMSQEEENKLLFLSPISGEEIDIDLNEVKDFEFTYDEQGLCSEQFLVYIGELNSLEFDSIYFLKIIK